MQETKIFKGMVDWFDIKLGYGFITRDDGCEDIFAHFSDIAADGFRLLNAGDKVSFEEDMSYNDKLKASNIILIERCK